MPTIYRARDDDGEFEFELQEGGRVTFGPDLPFSKGKEKLAYGGATTYALRVYSGKGNDTLIACFPHVEWFRPKDMKVERILVGPDGMILDIPAGPRRPSDEGEPEGASPNQWAGITIGGGTYLAGNPVGPATPREAYERWTAHTQTPDPRRRR